MKNNITRHGDLLIKPIEADKSKLKFIGKFESFTLAKGETTGHSHKLTAEPKTAFSVYQNKQGQYILEMEGNGKITHEEHSEVSLIPGMYVVGNEKEYNYFSEQSQRVID